MKIKSQQPIVVCGPSGSGKSTLLRRLLAEYKEQFAFTVSHTTRKARKGELDGREYHFVSREKMFEMIDQNEFIEHTEFSGNHYGTSKRSVRDALKSGRTLILEVDIEGVKALSSLEDLRPIFVFIRPPSKHSLVERLVSRATESPEALARRLEHAEQELQFADSGYVNFDLILVNDKLEDTYEDLKQFLSLNNGINRLKHN